MRSAIEIVEACLHGVRTRDLARAPVAPDVVYEDPFSPNLLVGREVTELLSGLLPPITDLRIERHIVEGPYVATLFEVEAVSGTFSACVCFRLSNGLIKEIRPFLRSVATRRRAS